MFVAEDAVLLEDRPDSPDARLRRRRWSSLAIAVLVVAGFIVAWRAVGPESKVPTCVELRFAESIPYDRVLGFSDGATVANGDRAAATNLTGRLMKITFRNAGDAEHFMNTRLDFYRLPKPLHLVDSASTYSGAMCSLP